MEQWEVISAGRRGRDWRRMTDYGAEQQYCHFITARAKDPIRGRIIWKEATLKHFIQLSLIGFLTFACALLLAPAGAVAQQSGSNPATLTLKQVKQRLKQNKQYIKQAKKSAKNGDTQGLNTAIQNYDRSMQGLNTAISHGGIQGTPSQQQEAYNRVQSATQKHIHVLNGLLSKVPSQAVPHIQHAIDVSQTGQQTAMSHLSQLQTQQAMEHGIRPAFGQAGGMGRSQGMGRPGGMGGGTGNAPMGGPGMGAGMGHAGGPPAGVGGGRGH